MAKAISRPNTFFTLPMILTCARFALVPAIGFTIIRAQTGYALAMFIIAALTDVLDGILARLLNQQTQLGIYLDPLADKMLIITCFVCLHASTVLPDVAIPFWLLILIIAKEIVLAAGAVYLLLAKNTTIKAAWTGKITMLLETAYVTFMLTTLYAGYAVSPAIFYAMRQTVVICIIGSLVYYIYQAFFANKKISCPSFMRF